MRTLLQELTEQTEAGLYAPPRRPTSFHLVRCNNVKQLAVSLAATTNGHR
jgi:hypothetical protein